ncbi:expressed unknown protein [Seminavis robusta]|uniref:Uncharacterized protein n=1 Tax=Seminavis robusta TaxID=568900 RepID=A0A9N8DTP4_9STRA|nr:expressed unknown protein [Seminavis robusta]|eukprot:Sro363_g126990.1 n/a (309) ;mRNA; f:68761-69826
MDEDHCVANPYGADTIINDNRNRFIKKVTLNSVVEVLAEGEGSAVRKPFHDRSGHIVYEFPATPEDDKKAQDACVSFYFAHCKGRLERNDAEEFMELVPPMASLRSLEEHKVIQEQLTEFYDSVDSLYQPPPSADIPEKAKWKVEITLKNELVWKLPLEHSSGNELVGIELVSAVWQLDQKLEMPAQSTLDAVDRSVKGAEELLQVIESMRRALEAAVSRKLKDFGIVSERFKAIKRMHEELRVRKFGNLAMGKRTFVNEQKENSNSDKVMTAKEKVLEMKGTATAEEKVLENEMKETPTDIVTALEL